MTRNAVHIAIVLFDSWLESIRL